MEQDRSFPGAGAEWIGQRATGAYESGASLGFGGGEGGTYPAGAYPVSTYGDSDAGMDAASESRERALAPYQLKGGLAPYEDDEPAAPTIIKGKGKPMASPIIKRRPRPLMMRLGIVALATCIVITGLFTITPLGSAVDENSSPFQVLSGVLVWHNQVGYRWYSVKWGDTVESIAAQFGVQVGGIYALNHLYGGEELYLGEQLKIPTDPHYGASYKPPTGGGPVTNGQRYGPNWWNSIAGDRAAEVEGQCGVDGKGVPTAYQLQPPNWGAYWMRGFIVWPNGYIYHTGVDLAAPYGNKIRAAQAGQVIWAGYDATNGLGWSVKIDHCFGISTVYGHMARLLVTTKQYVNAGDPVGLEGSTGHSTGPHLHFIVEKDNQYVDPMPYYGYSKAAIAKNPIYG